MSYNDKFRTVTKRLITKLKEQFRESARLEKAIKTNLRGLGYGG